MKFAFPLWALPDRIVAYLYLLWQNFGTAPAPGQRRPEAPMGPGQQPPQPPAEPERQLPPGNPALVGRVGAITNEGLFIETAQGPRLVQVEKDTKVQDLEGRELSVHDLRQGIHVAIFGEFGPDGRRLNAQTIVIVPPPRP